MKAENTKTAVVMIVVLGLILSSIVLSVLIYHQSPYYKSSKLIEAIDNKDYDLLESMLMEGTDPNVASFKSTFISRLCEVGPDAPLAVACRNDDIEAVKLLIQYGATAEYIEGTGWSPLWQAIWHRGPNSFEIIRILLDNGADPYWSESGSDAFFTVVETYPYLKSEDKSENLVRILDYLLTKYNETPASIASKAGKTLISQTVGKSDNVKMVEYLIENGDDVYSLYCGQNLYECAVSKNKSEIAEILKPYFNNTD